LAYGLRADRGENRVSVRRFEVGDRLRGKQWVSFVLANRGQRAINFRTCQKLQLIDADRYMRGPIRATSAWMAVRSRASLRSIRR
jgi:hypothetical protein